MFKLAVIADVHLTDTADSAQEAAFDYALGYAGSASASWIFERVLFLDEYLRKRVAAVQLTFMAEFCPPRADLSLSF